jgi:hypothetical protein
MEDLANELSQRVQIGLDQARTVINQVSNTILRKADPNKASEYYQNCIKYNNRFLFG